MPFKSIKGTHDILPDEIHRWQFLEDTIRSVANRFGYSEIRTPAFEDTALFKRSVGEDSDIVSKEMYTWEDRSGDSLTLRPELTAPVVRSFIQHNLGMQSALQRLYYIGPLFRRERPQKGRYRQFHQFGIEAFGSEYPEQDVEVILFAYTVFSDLGIKDLSLKLNSLGSGECRTHYKMALKQFLEPLQNDLSETSRKRLETNPMRILDTKDPDEQKLLQNAPVISDYWTPADKDHFMNVQELLKALDIPFHFDAKMVRGLDYYTRTTFEFISGSLGAQDAICGGGRYDGLVESLGGKATPGIGFAAGMERVLLSMHKVEINKNDHSVYIINMAESSTAMVLKIASDLRRKGWSVYMDTLRRSLKSQMREANKIGTGKSIIIGADEIKNGTAQVKDLITAEQQEIPLTRLADYFTI